MVGYSRRKFLGTSGVVVGGVGLTARSATAAPRERFLVNTASVDDRSNLDVVHRLEPVSLSVVRGAERDVKDLGERYARDVSVARTDPVDRPARASESASDEPLYDLQWDKRDQRIPEVHEVTRGEGSRVAVIDTGIAADHPDLERAVNEGLSRNFTEDDLGVGEPYGGYHGTHVAGIVAASDRNEVGVVGSAPAAELVDCRVFSETDAAETLTGFFGDVLAAIVYSAEIDADAANLSLGAYLDRRGLGPFWGKALNRTATYATRRGTLLVHAAGNVSTDLQHDGNHVDTSESARSVNVSATGPVGFAWGDPGLEAPPHAPSFYTNYGTNAIDLAAPGGSASADVLDDDGDDRPEGWFRDFVLNCVAIPDYAADGTYEGTEYGYDWVAGTSMAAPQVTAAVALVRSVHPDFTAGQVQTALEQAASVPEGYDKSYYGSGYLNTLGAVQN
ncbi:S8 family peptidase [Halegenticoccus soli]|uniref:S8 family peptidase n=1 Tax=Halegenticoccus soli TaxID=1985678 RepID=UPI000C6EE7A0|nr:S8 family serine peptidase [Halegenticoccus soli]